ncbi:dockerin domain-containing protein [Desulfonema limicola]|uniref:Dockerin domain-containing protein n=1 Tax=Desulfonema limicola TaxID=45656 RepID=A0A975GJT2_9BACT|nr:dockerin type I repeat-containing protein [Desulfonema limicola]QTA83817.1 dockerin domain-containing protein [Desulfonema limicola]
MKLSKERRVYFYLIIFIFFSHNEVKASFSIFSNRLEWESNTSGQIFKEDFESDTIGDHKTPYITSGNIMIDGINSQRTIQIFSDGLVNGSQAPHFRDFGAMISFTFPDKVSAFGFDFYCPEEWYLYINDLLVTKLPDQYKEFIGITSTEPLSSFVLTNPSYAQRGMSIDTISYTFSKLVIKGDINNDYNVNLSDALIILKLISGSDISNFIDKNNLILNSDINGDSKIGIEEVIYILKIVVELID